jgi:sortase (surface protein transpeptidase)
MPTRIACWTAGLVVFMLAAGTGLARWAPPVSIHRAILIGEPATATTSATTTTTTAAGRARTAPARDATSLPTQLTIPAIGVDTSLEPLGLMPDGTLQPPSQWQRAGWYAGGVRPGSIGPAVIAGHVDSVSGPAVFYRLRELKMGDPVIIRRRDGHVVTFVVDEVHAYPKATFPTALVYGPTPLPELRLITCTGDFDRNAHSYLLNLVVSAHVA